MVRRNKCVLTQFVVQCNMFFAMHNSMPYPGILFYTFVEFVTETSHLQDKQACTLTVQ